MKDLKQLTDEELMDLIRISDHSAFEMLLNRYFVHMVLFGRKFCKDREECRDVTTDIFANIWDKRETIHIPGLVFPFLFVVLKRKLLDRHKRKQHVMKYTDKAVANYSPNDETDHLIRHKQMDAIIRSEIQRLAPMYREVFYMLRVEHMERKVVAQILGVPEVTVRTRMNRALTQLKEALSPYVPHLQKREG